MKFSLSFDRQTILFLANFYTISEVRCPVFKDGYLEKVRCMES